MERSQRRHLAGLAKDRARRHIKLSWGDRSKELADDPKFVGRCARTPHPCSCLGCGNQRRIEGPTRAERLARIED